MTLRRGPPRGVRAKRGARKPVAKSPTNSTNSPAKVERKRGSLSLAKRECLGLIDNYLIQHDEEIFPMWSHLSIGALQLSDDKVEEEKLEWSRSVSRFGSVPKYWLAGVLVNEVDAKTEHVAMTVMDEMDGKGPDALWEVFEEMFGISRETRIPRELVNKKT